MQFHLGRIFLLGLFVAFAANATVAAAASKIYEGSAGRTMPVKRHSPSPLDNVYASMDVPWPIPDQASLSSEVVVPDDIEVSDINVYINLMHTYDSDLIVVLESPMGTVDTLINRRGEDGDNILICTLDDEAETDIAGGTAPFGGRWRPENPLSIFEGENAQFAWYLTVYDVAAADTGVLYSWGIELSETEEIDNVYGSTDVPWPIPDQASVSSELAVPDSVQVGDVNVFLNLMHTYDSDLIVVLESPMGTADTLINRRGEDGDNILICTLDDEAQTDIAAGAAPFNGEWRPEHPLSVFDGENAQFAWYLTVYDVAAADTGVLYSWGIVLSDASGVDDPLPAEPAEFQFNGIYPNPFNASTTFSFDLARAGNANLIMYDLLGRETATIFNGALGAGNHDIHFNAADLPSGVYIVRLSDGQEFQSQRVVLLK